MRKDNYVQKVGILGMKALPNALTKYGYTDVAYKILSRTDYPSYGYWKSLGETTLCELWEENQSRNHHMYSDAVNWIIRNIGGIKNCGIGYDKVCFEPYLFDENCSAKSSKMTRSLIFSKQHRITKISTLNLKTSRMRRFPPS